MVKTDAICIKLINAKQYRIMSMKMCAKLDDEK